MPSVTVAFLRALSTAVGLQVTPEGDIRHGADTLCQIVPDARGHVADETFFGLLAWIDDNFADRLDLVSAYAQSIGVDDLGALGLAIKTAPTLRASLERVERYFQLLTDTALYRLDETTTPPRFILNGGPVDVRLFQLRSECALAAFARSIRRFVDAPIDLAHVSFRHPCAGDPRAYAAAFGCPVLFDAQEDAIAFGPDALDQRNRLGDMAVSEFLTAHLDAKLESSPRAPSFRNDVLRRLATELSTGIPQAARIAREMGMSERTFFRRLSDQGLTFRDLVREAQSDVARTFLKDGDCTIAEVAFLTGFSDQSTFSRAFKRWEGETPAQYRSRAAPHLAGSATTLAGHADTERGART